EAEVRLDHLFLRLGGLLLPGPDDPDDALELVDLRLGLGLDPLDLPLGVALPALAGRQPAVARGVEEVAVVGILEGAEEEVLELFGLPTLGVAPELELALGLDHLQHHLLEAQREPLDDARVEPDLAEGVEDPLLLRPQGDV